MPQILWHQQLGLFSQQLNIAWDDAKIVSMHGRNQNLIAAVAQNSKVFSLTGGEHSPNQLCRKLCDHGMADVKVYVGENLSYPEEKSLMVRRRKSVNWSFLLCL